MWEDDNTSIRLDDYTSRKLPHMLRCLHNLSRTIRFCFFPLVNLCKLK